MLRTIIFLGSTLCIEVNAEEIPSAYDASTMESYQMQSILPAETAEYVYLATESLREVVGDDVKYYLADARAEDGKVVVLFRIPRTHAVAGGGHATVTVDKITKTVKRGLLSK